METSQNSEYSLLKFLKRSCHYIRFLFLKVLLSVKLSSFSSRSFFPVTTIPVYYLFLSVLINVFLSPIFLKLLFASLRLLIFPLQLHLSFPLELLLNRTVLKSTAEKVIVIVIVIRKATPTSKVPESFRNRGNRSS